MPTWVFMLLLCTVSAIVCASAGCAAPESKPQASPVATAWQGRSERAVVAQRGDGGQVPEEDAALNGSGKTAPAAAGRRERGAAALVVPVATVNGRAVGREQMVELLMRSRGAEVLEQFVVLEAAEGLAAQRNLGVSERDVAAEYDRALRELAGAGMASGAFNREAAESILSAVLEQRHVSHAEFMMGMRRNALLRRLANEEQVVTDAQVRAEFDRRYGPRVRVGVVRVASMNDVTRLRERLAAHPRSSGDAAPGGGGSQAPLQVESWGPFTAEDDEVPAIIRQTAFALEPGQVSDAQRIPDGLVLIRLEEKTAARSDVSIAAVRMELEAAVRERLTKKAMAALYERLFLESMVKINDRALKESFERRYPQRTR